MALPELIEIVPVKGPVSASLSVPGSKSITNRLLILAALSEGSTLLKGALWSEDTEIMINCLAQLGFDVQVEADPEEACNRTITVLGRNGTVPAGGSESNPLDLFTGNAGTAARFLAAFLCLGQGVYRLAGSPRMHERPQGALFKALRELGYRIDSVNDRLPALIYGAGPRRGKCSVSIRESSQFASALLLSGSRGGWEVRVTDENADESPYVRLTAHLIETFPAKGGTVTVEADASSASYFWGVDSLLHGAPDPWLPSPARTRSEEHNPGGVIIRNPPTSEWQIDSRFRYYSGVEHFSALAGSQREVSRATDLGDSIMTAIVIAPFWAEATKFTHLGRLRVQECERVAALRTEMGKCGANIHEQGDVLTVTPSALHGAEIETYDDHRMAMCFGLLGITVPGMRLRNPRCVRKTFPNFFQKLAAAPPNGIGAAILNARTGGRLSFADLYAE